MKKNLPKFLEIAKMVASTTPQGATLVTILSAVQAGFNMFAPPGENITDAEVIAAARSAFEGNIEEIDLNLDKLR